MYKPPFIYRSRHLSTILPAIYRKRLFDLASIPTQDDLLAGFERERVNTPDDDFFDIDCLKQQSKRVVILLHGLEGSSKQHYMLSQAYQFYALGFDIISVNFRTCSGEMSRTKKLYHSGDTDDLAFLIDKVKASYAEISLIGFSLGGNVLLKYLGETKTKTITSAAAFSAPLDLESCAYELEKGFSRIYCREFMSTLSRKAESIQKRFLDSEIKHVKARKLKSFLDYDEQVTAPLFGFKSAKDYWTRSSSRSFLKDIQVPTLIMSAKNDPFLGEACYPESSEIQNENLRFKYPQFGGHVGFTINKLSEPNLMDLEAKFFILGASSL
jgi:predicted alpha/beta-fold hydrolase